MSLILDIELIMAQSSGYCMAFSTSGCNVALTKLTAATAAWKHVTVAHDVGYGLFSHQYYHPILAC